MVIAVNYADKKFQRAQKLNSRSARQWGADKVIEYGPKDIDEAFRRHNEEILNAPRGGGYYLWKPYIYRKAYGLLGENDYLVYTDSGSVYVNKIKYLIDCMEHQKVSVMIFSLEKERIERCNTKRDAFVLTGCDEAMYTDTPQSIGGYLVCKKAPEVEAFLDEVLRYAQDIRIISDEPILSPSERCYQVLLEFTLMNETASKHALVKTTSSTRLSFSTQAACPVLATSR